jgi:hypothetical protein
LADRGCIVNIRLQMRFVTECKLSLSVLLAALCLVLCQHSSDFEGFETREVNVAAIVGVRNVEQYIVPFLRLLAPFVNFTIILDDSSTDATVAAIESVALDTKVRQVLVKDGAWNRSETDDRNELLRAGSRAAFQRVRRYIQAHSRAFRPQTQRNSFCRHRR